MIVFLTLIYVLLLFVLIKMKILPNSPLTWLTTLVWMVVLFIFLFIPLQWGAPSGPVVIKTRTVQIVPNVSGQVVEVPIKANAPVKKGDILFRIDPEPFQIAVSLAEATLARVQTQADQDQLALNAATAAMRQAEASLSLAQQRYDDDAQLAESGTISQNRLERRQADLDGATAAVDQTRAGVSRAEAEIGAVTADGVVAKISEAQAALDQARWNLAETEVRAPSDGFVTNMAISPGIRAVSLPLAPSMVFVDTSEKVLVTEIHQTYMRHLEPGQPVEIAFKIHPGKIVTGTVETVFEIASQGQVLVSGMVAASGGVVSEPFLVRVKLDDAAALDTLPAGAVGTSAIYTQSVQATHVVRKVMIRMEAILNYLRPGL